MKSMNVAQLRAFHTVAAEGGFTKAARLLNVTQPTLSQEVKALEEAYGVLLLDRSRRTVTPTSIGEGCSPSPAACSRRSRRRWNCWPGRGCWTRGR